MNFEMPQEYEMLQELAAKFVRDELVSREPQIIQQDAAGQTAYLPSDELKKINERAKELGLFGLDAPEEVGGAGMGSLPLVGVNEELGYTPIFYVFPPDTPNLVLILHSGNEEQKAKYLVPLMEGTMTSAIAISEAGAGSDPSGMKSKATKVEGGWLITGRKIWITNAKDADFLIVFAVTGRTENQRPEVTAFFVDKGAKGFTVERRIPMLAGMTTYEIAFDECFVSDSMVLGEVGGAWGPMQKRLDARRVEIAAWSVGAARRALDMMIEFANQRSTFGDLLSNRQMVQSWIVEARTNIHACRLMCQSAAWKIDQGIDVRTEVSMLKAYSTEMAWKVVDNAMQLFGGMGMTKELPLYLLAENMRVSRIYEGPTEIHVWRAARDICKSRF